jgi:hypothetical protein
VPYRTRTPTTTQKTTLHKIFENQLPQSTPAKQYYQQPRYTLSPRTNTAQREKGQQILEEEEDIYPPIILQIAKEPVTKNRTNIATRSRVIVQTSTKWRLMNLRNNHQIHNKNQKPMKVTEITTQNIQNRPSLTTRINPTTRKITTTNHPLEEPIQ